MSPMRIIILVASAIAAIGAVFLVRAMQAPAKAVAAKPAIVAPAPVIRREVLIAKKDLPVGQFLGPDDLAWQAWPEYSPAGAFTLKKDKPNAIAESVGAVVRQPLVTGEPLTANKIVKPGQAGFMAAVLTPGMRAVAINISPESGAGGFVQPNDRVDVMLTKKLNPEVTGLKAEASRSGIILSNVRVLAIDGVYAQRAEGQGMALLGTRATLELSSADATLVVAAEKTGPLTLALRSVSDLQGDSGATAVGRNMRSLDGEGERIRVYRYGVEKLTSASKGG